MRTLRILHKWLGLVVGLQVLLWTVSGLVFAWLSHEDVAAEASARDVAAPPLDDAGPVVEPGSWLHDDVDARYPEIRLMPIGGDWVYRVQQADHVELRRAADGSRFEVDAALVRRLATARYAGEGELRGVRELPDGSLEARGSGPVWRADFGDAEGTSLYFSAQDGRLVAVRNASWRLFDLFWMLHTMDYRGRDDFNHPLVILVTTAALWIGISGGILLIPAFRRRA